MNVIIDADGCPVVKLTAALCSKYSVPCLILTDTSHSFSVNGAQTLVFDKGADSVDYAVANRAGPGDLVITQDYGLASMCLARRARVLNQDGREYTSENISALLEVRYNSKKLRAAGVRIKGPQKRTCQQDRAFAQALEKILGNSVQG